MGLFVSMITEEYNYPVVPNKNYNNFDINPAICPLKSQLLFLCIYQFIVMNTHTIYVGCFVFKAKWVKTAKPDKNLENIYIYLFM